LSITEVLSDIRRPTRSASDQRHVVALPYTLSRDTTQKYEEDQNNQAACLNILTNAVIVWNTVYIQAALEALREEGYAVKDDDLVQLSPARFAHIHRYGKYHFDVETARSRRRLRPLRR
jgi:hypothetical protein